MRQFNAPPGWPDPPNARWRPPKHWGPSETWPPAPAGWRFWVDENGRPVRGPIGRYGGPSVFKLGAVAAVVLTLLGLVLFNPLAGGDDNTAITPAPSTEVETPPASEGTPEAPETAPPTTTGTTSPTTAPTPQRTHEPSRTPTSATSTEPPSPEPSTPKQSSTPKPIDPTTAPTTTTAAIVYRNCAEVRAAGKAPLHRGDPGYSPDLDRNGDGTACDRGNS
ncbi:excalibur calcium-binding domain-containing protein [Kribbella swartbergensis]